MKTLLFKIFLFFIGLNSFSQSYLTNYSPSRAYSVCNNAPRDNSFSSEQGFKCLNGVSRLYYQLSPIQTTTLGGTVFINFQAFGDSTTTLPLTSTYYLYGPFEKGSNYISLLEADPSQYIIGGNTSTTVNAMSESIMAGKVYILEIKVNSCQGRINFSFLKYSFNCGGEVSCENCIPTFQPISKQFVVSAWVKEEAASTDGSINYLNGFIRITIGSTVYDFIPTGQIIDGWQRIEGVFQANSIGDIRLELIVSEGVAYFDDIRIFPYDGSMITYVYDPITKRLLAELDERNYAKIYEYDEEGKLIRVKKETEKGIMTIQENRENSSKND